ncbi:MAG: hypothetical protein QXS91_03840 [Candidatus Anstonellales archaeon]
MARIGLTKHSKEKQEKINKLKGITKTSKGKIEQRLYLSEGDFIIYGYRDLDGKMIEGKYSIILKHKNNKIEQIMIVKTKNGRELIVKHENIDKIPDIAYD